MNTTVLIVDDEPEILETTKWAFEMAGFQVHTAASAEEALPQARENRPDVLLIDYKLPLMNGLELLGKLRDWLPNAVAIMITGLTHQSEDLEEESRRMGAAGFLLKPLQIEGVLKTVRELIRPSTSSGRTEIKNLELISKPVISRPKAEKSRDLSPPAGARDDGFERCS